MKNLFLSSNAIYGKDVTSLISRNIPLVARQYVKVKSKKLTITVNIHINAEANEIELLCSVRYC